MVGVTSGRRDKMNLAVISCYRFANTPEMNILSTPSR